MPTLNTLKVGAVDRLTPQSVVISIDVPNHLSSSYVYLPGQYITLELEINGNTVRRSYSICSSPNSGLLQVGIKEVPNGIFSTYVNRKIKKGDEIKAGKPEGRFTFNSKNESIPIMAVAAGSGITPIMSIVRSFLDSSPNIPFTLIYGNKTLEKTMFYKVFVSSGIIFTTQAHLGSSWLTRHLQDPSIRPKMPPRRLQNASR